MKKRIALLLASVMAVSSMTVIPAAADEERPTISFFDKNSGIKAFDDRIAEELMNRTGVNIDLISPTGDAGRTGLSGYYPDGQKLRYCEQIH